MASGEFQIAERPQSIPGRQFTTAKTIEAEHEILRRMREGQDQVEPVLSGSQAIAVADQHSHLNRAQRSVVEDVLSSPDRIQAIQGFAGAGKTTTLTAIRSAAETEGNRNTPREIVTMSQLTGPRYAARKSSHARTQDRAVRRRKG